MESDQEHEAGWRQPAPGDLKLIQEFVNSSDLEDGRDDLDTPGRLHAWLTERGLLRAGEPVDEADRRRLLALREALNDLLLANNDGSADPEAIARMNRLAAGAALRICLTPGGGARLEPEATGLEGVIARLLAIVYTAIADGNWSRFKVCRDDHCRWAYYDYSKNHSRTWCTMTICGNRNKVRAYQRRRHEVLRTED